MDSGFFALCECEPVFKCKECSVMNTFIKPVVKGWGGLSSPHFSKPCIFRINCLLGTVHWGRLAVLKVPHHGPVGRKNISGT